MSSALLRLLVAFIAQTGVWWIAAVRAHFSDAFAAAVLGAIAVNLFFNLPSVSLFSLVVHEHRATATFGEIVGRAATIILLSAFIQLPLIVAVGWSQDPEVIGGALFVTSLLPTFIQGAITVVRGVSIASGRTRVR